MLSDVNQRTGLMWRRLSKEIGVELRNELSTAPTGARMHELMAEQVTLITSLPIEAAQRVHDLVAEAMVSGQRAATIASDILRTQEVTDARARLIARTEVSRASTALTQSRAEYAGSEGYIWRTSGDMDVRDSHAEMEGKFVRWDTVPRLSDGTRTHAGAIYNCRCFCEPVFKE